MKNIIKVGLFNLGFTILGLNSTLTQAAVVDFSQCGVNSSFAIVTQSEGPTYACGGIDNGVGNPINVLNGNKFEAVEDFKELPAFKGLSFSRFYNSQSHANTTFGFGWYSSFDVKLYEQPDIIQIRLESGQRINFKKNKINVGNNQFVIRALPLNPADGWIEKKIDGSGWIWHKTKSNQDYFFQYLGGKDPNLAHITKITAQADIEKNSPQLNFNFYYDQQQRLSVVKNLKGDQLSFQYSTTKFGLPQITLTTPLGKYYYFLDQYHNLAQVVYPDGRRFKYSYDPKFQGGDIHNLTAKSVFDRSTNQFKLLSQWQYDKQDRAFFSKRTGGIEKVTIQFDARTRQNMPANYAVTKPVFKNIVTNSLGQKTTYTYQIDGTQFQLLESLGAGCASCGEVNKRYRFNAQGLVAYAADLNSSGQVIRAIDLKYNDLGEVIARTVSGVGIEAQTTSYEYESYLIQQNSLANASSPLLSQLNQQDFRRLKAESRNSVVAGKQYRKQYIYNQNNQLISVKESGFSPLGDSLVRETKYGYDPQGRLSWEDGPLPNGPTNSPHDSDIITYQYNDTGLIESWSRPRDGSSTTIIYDRYGRVDRYIKAQKLLTGEIKQQLFDFTYGANNKPAIITVSTDDNKDKFALNYHYDSNNRLSTLTDHQGNLIKAYHYDAAQRVNAKLSAQEGLKVFAYNTESKITDLKQLTTDQVIETGYRYDDFGRLTTIADSKQGVLSHIDYFDDGLSGRVLNRHGDALWQRYTGDGKLQTEWNVPAIGHGVLGPSKIEQHYTLGQKTLVQSDGTRTATLYDDFGRLTVLDSSLQGKTKYRYDNAGRVSQTLLATGAILDFKYDQYNRVIERHLKQAASSGLEATNQTTYFDYEGAHLVKVRDPLQTIAYQYDKQGKLKHRSIFYKGLKQPLITYYSYDKEENPHAIILPDGTQLAISKDRLNYQTPQQLLKHTLLEKQGFSNGSSGQKELTYVMGNQIRLGFEYSATGIWRGLHYARGDKKQSLSLIQSAYADEAPALLLSQHWHYDDQGRILKVNDTGIFPNQQEYLYDSKYHVVARSSADNQPQEHYFYDALGNRLLGQDYQAKQPIQAYDYQSGRLISVKSGSQQQSVQYNMVGQPVKYLTRKGVLRFSYINGQISKVWKGKQLVAAYQYNDAGQRIKKTTYIDQKQQPLSQPKVNYYFYNGSQLAGELNAQGNITRQYIYTANRLLAIMDYAGNGYKPQTSPLNPWQRLLALFTEDRPTAQIHFVINDYMGRPRMVTDEQQRIVWQDQGKALFGESSIVNQSYNLNIRYPGQYADTETGLYYNGYRYYDPATGRYTTPDPLGLRGGENQYGYVNQQPNQYFDPQGLLLFAFDGTGNTTTNDHPSNVEKFMDAYASKEALTKQIDVTKTLWTNQTTKFTSNADAGLTANHDNVFYVAGAGTEDETTLIGSNSTSKNAVDNVTGGSLPNRVDQMLVYFSQYVQKVMEAQKNAGDKKTEQTINIDTVGFSRGAASARLFASKLEKLLTTSYADPKTLNNNAIVDYTLAPYYQNDDAYAKKIVPWGRLSLSALSCLKIKINFRFMGVWDSVPAFGLDPDDDMTQYNDKYMTVAVSDRFKSVAHAVAVNDHREGFRVRSIYPDAATAAKKDNTGKGNNQTNTRIERGFMGAHSDIGGGYSDGDLSDVALMWMIDQAKNSGVVFNDKLIESRGYNVISNPIVHDSTGNEIGGNGRGTSVGPYFDPGRDFAWASSTNSHINQHLTGMDQSTLAKYLAGYANPSEQATAGSQANHLKLNWQQTLQFQNASYTPKNPGKFEKYLQYEQEFTRDSDCKPGEIFGGCKALDEYQKEKSMDVTGSLTIVYDPRKEKEIIQTQKYLDWIKANYGTSLTFKLDLTKDTNK